MTQRDPVDELAGAAPLPLPALSAELEAELARLQPVATRRPLRELAIVGIASTAYALVLLAVLGYRRDFDELPIEWLLGAAGLWLAGFAVPLHFVVVPRPGAVTPRWRAAATCAVVGSIAFVALGLAIHPHGPSSLHYGAEHFLRGHWCLWLGLATALVPVAIVAILLRGALAVRSRWIAAAVGAGGGALGGLLLHFHCPIADELHVGLVHGGVVGVAALLAAALLPRAMDVR
jgi:hypothetical protein